MLCVTLMLAFLEGLLKGHTIRSVLTVSEKVLKLVKTIRTGLTDGSPRLSPRTIDYIPTLLDKQIPLQ